MGVNQSTRKQSDPLSSWIEASRFSVDDIQDALFNEASLRVLLERIAVGNNQNGGNGGGNKAKASSLSVTPNDNIEYCLSAHQRHRLNASVAVTNSLVEGGIVDKGIHIYVPYLCRPFQLLYI